MSEAGDDVGSGGPKQEHAFYYPFRKTLFTKPMYKGHKYGNMGIVRGLRSRKGFPVQKIGRFAGTFRASGHKNKKHQTRYKRKMRERMQKKRKVEKDFVKDIIRETVGWAPYEKRIMELIKSGNPKKGLKFARKRLGSHKKAKFKRAKLEEFQLAETKRLQQLAKERRDREAAAAAEAAKKKAAMAAKKGTKK